MSIKMVLFDLDGTLLPMDQDKFTRAYFHAISKKMAPHGYEPEKLIEAIWKGTSKMIMNDGQESNEDVFWKKFIEIYGEDALNDKDHFDDFYRNDFQSVKNVCGFDMVADTAVLKIKDAGYRIALATNPIFPSIATESRIRWTNLSPEDFELYTTYENSNFAKPNPKYYLDIAEKLGVKPEECLMVGNDVEEDMIAESIGMKVFLITSSLINKEDKDISKFPNGNFTDLLDYLDIEK